MAASQQIRIHMSGAGPYGFRLIGGDSSPLYVSKIRPASKAQVAGLIEGDVILTMNDVSCKGLNHATATGLMESSSSGLSVLVLRGNSARNEVNSALASLGPQVKRLTEGEASALVQRQSTVPLDSNDYTMNGDPQSPGTFRLSAPPSGGTLKQMRLSKRETGSSSEPVITPDGLSTGPPDNSGYYTTDRTTTDGGKTTRILEEVKTEKFGGTTLTKVTKQEFTSYNSSSDPQNNTLQPQYSIIRSGEQGHPVLLGAPTQERPHAGDLGDRGWTVTSNVERRNVQTQPYEVRIVTNQEPTTGWTMVQDRPEHGSLERPGMNRLQPIPAIQIQFEPNVGETRTLDGQTLREGGSNFEVRIGDQVTYQPKLERNVQYEFHPPTVKVQSVQMPRIVAHTEVYSTQRQDHPRPAEYYGGAADPPRVNYSAETSDPYGYKESYNKPGTNRPQSYQYDVEPTLQAAPVVHHQYKSAISESKNRDDETGRYSVQNRTDAPVHYRPVNDPPQHPQYESRELNPEQQYRPSSAHQQKQGYNLRPEYHDDSQLQTGYNPEPQPHPGIRPQVDYAPRQQQEPAHPQKGYNPEPQSYYKPSVGQPQGYRPEPEPRFQPGTNPDPRYGAPQIHPGYIAEQQARNEPRSQPPFEYGTEQAQNSYLQRTGYGNEPQYRPASDVQPHYEPQPLGQRKPGPYPQAEPQPIGQKKVGSYFQAAPARVQPMEPDFYGEVPAAQRAPAPQAYSQKPSHVQEAPYFPPEPRGGYGAYPETKNWSGNVRQMEKVERVEISGGPKWIPGSKLPTKQPARSASLMNLNRSFDSSERNVLGPRGPNNPAETGYGQSMDDGWYEAPRPGAKVVSNVALSRVYEPKQQQQFVNGGQYQLSNEAEEYGQPGWPHAGHPHGQHPHGQHDFMAAEDYQGSHDVWRPHSDAGPVPQFRDYRENYEGMGRAAGPHDHYHQQQTAPPPPAPMLPPGPPPTPGHHDYPQMYQEPMAPPPPAAPPIDHLKIYRGNSTSDKGYGLTTLEERVKISNYVAHSVLSPENKNSRGQKLFLRRRDNAHKWTKEGPDPKPEKTAAAAGAREQPWNNPNAWAPKSGGMSQARPPLPPLAPVPEQSLYEDNATPGGGGTSAYSLANDMALSGGKGGRLFAKKRAKAEQWTSDETTGRQSAPPPNVRPMTWGGYGIEGPSSQQFDQYASNPPRGGTGAGEQLVTNRLQGMIKPKGSTGVWSQQATHVIVQDGRSQGISSYSAGPTAAGFAPNQAPSAATAHRQIRFQGAPSFSSFPSSPPVGQPQKVFQGQRAAPKQFGPRAMVGHGQGFTDL